VCRSGLGRNALRWARLACSTSPRYLVYEAASELFFASEGPGALGTQELSAIVARLPIGVYGNGQLSWRAAAAAIAQNFHLFLESNRS
jgi:hypothetical protein